MCCQAAQQTGCDLHLGKPLRKTTLLRAVDMILRSCC
jgi:hypothetical protein